MKITASVEYAMQALLEIANSSQAGKPIAAREIADVQGIPLKFLENILAKLRHGSIIESIRGASGGYILTRAASDISVADVIRCVEGPLAAVGDKAPESAKYKGNAKHLTDAWIVTRVSLRDALEEISLDQLLTGEYKRGTNSMLTRKDAWKRR